MRFTVSHKVNIGGAAFAMMILLIAAGILVGGKAMEGSFKEIEQRSRTTAQLNELQFLTQRLTKAEGDFLLTRANNDFRTWTLIFRELLTVVDAVDSRLQAPEQRAALDDFTLAQLEYKKTFTRIRALIARATRSASKPKPGDPETGDPASTILQEARQISVKKSIVLTEVMIDAVHDMVSFNQRQAERESGFAIEALQQSQFILAALVALGFIATFVLGVFAARTISRPIAQLTAASREIARGRFDPELDIHSRDEIGELAASIQTMARELEASYASLEEKVKERTADLARSNAELEQFAYVASHDLQEPLRTISGFAQLLGSRYQGKLDDRADEYIFHLTDGARRMQDLVKDLLAYSRIRSRQRPMEVVDCAGIVEGVIAALETVIDESGAEVIVDPLPELLSDKTLMTQLFLNLIGNAIKFRRDEPPRIHISARKEAELWQFSVQDNGIGMEERHKDRIFTIFQRLHSREEYEGTGMGLAICKKIVEQHGGELWVESRPGEGSTFHWTVPAMKPTPKPDHPDEEHREA